MSLSHFVTCSLRSFPDSVLTSHRHLGDLMGFLNIHVDTLYELCPHFPDSDRLWK
jgi:hypothetical protein